jgi:hypothetical protein
MLFSRRNPALPVGAALLGTFLLFAGCGDDGDEGTGPGDGGGSAQIPASWAGEWSITTTVRDCTSGAVIDTDMTTEILCANEDFSVEDDASNDVPCTGTISDTAIDVNCTYSADVPGCSVSITIDMDGTRSADSFTITGTATRTFSGADCGSGSDCQSWEITGTRISTSQTGCSGTISIPVSRYVGAVVE